MANLFEFEHVRSGGLHWHVMHASDSDIVEPLWPGLWELEYGDNPSLNPFLRFGINNGEGESLAVWRALAWAMTMGTTRVGLPGYYRDQAAHYLGVDPTEAILVPWEYEIELERAGSSTRTRGSSPRVRLSRSTLRPQTGSANTCASQGSSIFQRLVTSPSSSSPSVSTPRLRSRSSGLLAGTRGAWHPF